MTIEVWSENRDLVRAGFKPALSRRTIVVMERLVVHSCTRETIDETAIKRAMAV